MKIFGITNNIRVNDFITATARKRKPMESLREIATLAKDTPSFRARRLLLGVIEETVSQKSNENLKVLMIKKKLILLRR